MVGRWEIFELNGPWISGNMVELNGELSIAMFDYKRVNENWKLGLQSAKTVLDHQNGECLMIFDHSKW